ncbi:hypothetical protein V8E51_013626 [Hyaloscypha variabilis]
MTRRASHGLDMAGQAAEEQQQLTPDLGLPDSSTLQRPAESSGMYPNQRRVRPERACRVCKKSFSKSEHLKRHLRSHTKERPYTCTTCGKSYSRNDTLLRHERAHSVPGTVTSALQDLEVSSLNGDQGMGPFRQQGGDSPTSCNARDMAAESQPRQQPRIPLLQQMAVPDFPFSSPNFQENQPPRFSTDILADSTIPGYTDTTNMTQPPIRPSLQNNLALPSHHSGLLDEEFPPASWLLADDFDIDALDNALTVAMADWVQTRPQDFDQPAPSMLILPPSPPSVALRSIESERNRQSIPATAVGRQPNDLVSKQWFTRLPPQSSHVQSRAGSEAPSEQFHVNERYWDKLSQTLVPRFIDPSIPPAEHLNLYLQLYASKFHPMLPVIHLPTFRPNSRNSHLLLSMCSLGSLFIQYPTAAIQGRGIFERVNKVVLASWETHLFSNKIEALVIVQTALLGQTFGMLSGKAKDMTMIDAFHGTLLVWARTLGVPREAVFSLPAHDITDDEKDRLWREWAHAEQQLRLGLAVLVHDAELASLLHRESTMIRSILAPTAAKWYALLRDQAPRNKGPFPTLGSWMKGEEDQTQLILQSVQDSRFTLYSMLESINVAIIEAGQANKLDTATIQHFQRRLLVWYELNAGVSVNYRGGVDPFHTRILWHSTFMALFADFDLLEAAVGRDGHDAACASNEKVHQWASGPNAARCLIHSLLLQDEIENMQLRSEPALHVPRILFWAGLVALCYSKHASPGSHRPPDFQAQVFPEIKILGPTAHARLVEAFISGPGLNPMVHIITVCKSIDQLQKLSRWGVSHTFARILSSALQANGDGAIDREGIGGQA